MLAEGKIEVIENDESFQRAEMKGHRGEEAVRKEGVAVDHGSGKEGGEDVLVAQQAADIQDSIAGQDGLSRCRVEVTV